MNYLTVIAQFLADWIFGDRFAFDLNRWIEISLDGIALNSFLGFGYTVVELPGCGNILAGSRPRAA